MTSPDNLTRRRVLALAGAGSVAAPALLAAATPARATPSAMNAAIRIFVGAGTLRPGRIALDIPPLVENGNSVPLTVSVESPMRPDDHVRRIALFNEKNPLPQVAVFHLSPRSGKAAVTTRIRLADSQRVVGIAEMSDGTFWSAEADVIVTLAACVES